MSPACACLCPPICSLYSGLCVLICSRCVHFSSVIPLYCSQTHFVSLLSESVSFCPPLSMLPYSDPPLLPFCRLCVLLSSLICMYLTYLHLFFLVSSLCVLFSSLIHVQCTKTPLCLLISRLCVLSLSLICVHCTHTLLCHFILRECMLSSSSSIFIILTSLFFPSCLECVYFFFIFSMVHTQSQLPFLCRLYVLSFSFISTDILPSWIKPYLEIWDHGLLKAWNRHQSVELHANV